MQAAIGYIRVSTKRQAVEGLSMASQQERIRAYCSATGLELDEHSHGRWHQRVQGDQPAWSEGGDGGGMCQQGRFGRVLSQPLCQKHQAVH